MTTTKDWMILSERVRTATAELNAAMEALCSAGGHVQVAKIGRSGNSDTENLYRNNRL